MASRPHFDGKEDEVEPLSGDQKGYFFPPRAFNIVWGNDNRYWRIPQKGDRSPAELMKVSWLEVTTSKELPAGKYNITFKISLTQGADGWDNRPVFLMAKVGKKGRYSWKRVKLSGLDPDVETPIPPNEKFEIEVIDGADRKIYFGIYEVWSGKWKTGLKIHGATVEAVN